MDTTCTQCRKKPIQETISQAELEEIRRSIAQKTLGKETKSISLLEDVSDEEEELLSKAVQQVEDQYRDQDMEEEEIRTKDEQATFKIIKVWRRGASNEDNKTVTARLSVYNDPIPRTNKANRTFRPHKY